jgi:hypothetical protein
MRGCTRDENTEEEEHGEEVARKGRASLKGWHFAIGGG